MGKLVSIVTTCLVVLSVEFISGNSCLGQRIPRRTVIGTTDRRGGLVPKYLDSINLGTENNSLKFAMEWQDGPSLARRTITSLSIELNL